MSHPFRPTLKPMEARVRTTFPDPPDWAYEPKWDGFRMLAWSGEPPRLDSRNERPLLRYFPELEPALAALPAGTVVDGEVIVVVGGRTEFDALQMRVHPAESRVRMLSEQTPASLVAFDLLAVEGHDLRPEPFATRRERLVELASGLGAPWHLTPSTTDVDVAKRWFDEFEPAGCDGIVAKRLGGRYVEGKRDMAKIKHRRSVDVVVGGYRVHKEGDRIGSLLLGLHDDDGELHFVGHCSGFSDDVRVKLLERFRELRDDESFGQDARAPGGESRWSAGKDLDWVPVQPVVVAQVSYDQLAGARFRHASRFERWRPDKDPSECTFDQLDRPAGAGFDEVVRVAG